jgi:alkylation response protein AidB-like acyl-CoA dehydrogenase
MDFGLTDDQREIQRTARELLAERAKPERVREHAESGRTDEQLWKELCELGWPGIAVAEEHGGQGLGQIELSILCEELGRSLAPVPFLATAMAATVIQQDGSPEQRERWLPGLAGGETIGALGTTVDGTAELVLGGREADVFVLIDEDGSGRIVAAGEAEVTPVESVDPTRSTARVSGGDGEAVGDGGACAGLGRALVSVSAELVGVCDRALAMTVEYVKDRKQFGVPVGSFQAIKHKMSNMFLAVERSRSLCYFAVAAIEEDAPERAAAVAMAKAASDDCQHLVCRESLQSFGGIGFTWEHDGHFFMKRATADGALLGGAAAHSLTVAAELG